MQNSIFYIEATHTTSQINIKFVNDGKRDKVHDMPNVISVQALVPLKLSFKYCFLVALGGTRKIVKRGGAGGGGGRTRIRIRIRRG